MIKLDTSGAAPFLPNDWLECNQEGLERARQWLRDGSGAGGDFTGWVGLPHHYDKEEFRRVKAAAQKIGEQSSALVVIGIGGSYLGARGVIEDLCTPYYNEKEKATPNIYFAGNTLSGDALDSIMTLLENRDFSINVISKSGTTTEPAVAFRFFKELCEERYGKSGARERIYATTDRARGALRTLSDEEGYESFIVPDNIGGRYSVLTPVGLLPIAACGIDIDALMQGAAQMADTCAAPGDNIARQYAAARMMLYRAGKKIEVLASYEPSFRFMTEWWKQLYGESEGKEGKGIFPASCEFTADLHSMGQYLQEGERHLFETIVRFDSTVNLPVPDSENSEDGLDYLKGRALSFVAEQAMNGTYMAHCDGGVPNLILHAGKNTADNLGALIYFFEYACALSGYLLGVNPFDQPGVEAYKKNMFALLGKPGYEEHRAALLSQRGQNFS